MIRILILSLMIGVASADEVDDAVTTTAFLQWVYVHCPGIISRGAYRDYKDATVAVSGLTEDEFESRMTKELDYMARYNTEAEFVCDFARDKLDGVTYGGI